MRICDKSMTTQQYQETRVLADVHRFGPARAAEIHRLNLRQLVETLTRIDTSNAGKEVIAQTLENESVYKTSGFAVLSFPTYWHRELMGLRSRANQDYAQVKGELESTRDRKTRSPKESVEREKEVKDLESELIAMNELCLGSPPNVMNGIRISGTLNRHEAYGALICQFENNGNICEVYSEGGYPVSSKAYRLHKYTVMKYDKKTGNRLGEQEVPWNSSLLIFATTTVTTAAAGYYLGFCPAATTLLLTGAGTGPMIHGLGLPYKKIFERRILRKAQQNWERKQNES